MDAVIAAARLMTGGIRLTGGKLAAKSIAAPIGLTRPSAARARKALFDVLTHRIGVDFAASHVLDIFAGAGTLGFEALSRRSRSVIFIDHSRAALRQIARNAQILNVADQCFPLHRDGLRPGRRPQRFSPVSLVFVDPPYRSGLAARAIAAFDRAGWFAADVVIILEEAAAQEAQLPQDFLRIADHKIGAARFDILSREANHRR